MGILEASRNWDPPIYYETRSHAWKKWKKKKGKSNRLIIKRSLGLMGHTKSFCFYGSLSTSCVGMFYHPQKWRELNAAEGSGGWSRDPAEQKRDFAIYSIIVFTIPRPLHCQGATVRLFIKYSTNSANPQKHNHLLRLLLFFLEHMIRSTFAI